MAKCKRCNKGGLFFKVNTSGICIECERIEKLQLEESNLKAAIASLQTECNKTEQSYNEIKEKKRFFIIK